MLCSNVAEIMVLERGCKKRSLHFLINDSFFHYKPMFFCAAVSFDSILRNLRALERGMELTRSEFSAEEENPVLKTFLDTNSPLLDSLTAEEKTAQVSLS